jgi:hypothetical protein
VTVPGLHATAVWKLTADALDIIACLYAYSCLSFSGMLGFADTCAQQQHRLREYTLGHSEAEEIMGAID